MDTAFEFRDHFFELINFGLSDAYLTVVVEEVEVVYFIEEQGAYVYEFDPISFLLRGADESVVPYLFLSLQFGEIEVVELVSFFFFWELLYEFMDFIFHEVDIDDFFEFKELLQFDDFLSWLAVGGEVEKL